MGVRTTADGTRATVRARPQILLWHSTSRVSVAYTWTLRSFVMVVVQGATVCLGGRTDTTARIGMPLPYSTFHTLASFRTNAYPINDCASVCVSNVQLFCVFEF